MALVDEWARRFPFPAFGVAICAGPASNIDALDIDSESEDILSRCPRSPLDRRGRRGRMPIFQHNPKLKKREKERNNLVNDGKAREGIQLLSSGNYFVIPPSIHPDTLRPYEWLGDYNISNYSILDLEMLSQDELDDNVVYISRFPLTTKSNPMGESSGRNNKLTAMCYAKLKDCPWKNPHEVAEELVSYDREAHSPPYFYDPKEMYFHKAETPYERALLFVLGSIDRMHKKGDL